MAGIVPGVLPPHQLVQDARRRSGHPLSLASQVRGHALHHIGHLIGSTHQGQLAPGLQRQGAGRDSDRRGVLSLSKGGAVGPIARRKDDPEDARMIPTPTPGRLQVAILLPNLLSLAL